MQFAGKTAIITGSGRGIGKAIAYHFGKLGANVVLVGTSEEVHFVSEKFIEEGIHAISIRADIKIEAEVDSMINQVIDHYGKIDILVNNAGITRDTLIMRMNESDWDTVLDTNLKGAFLCSKSAIKFMMKQRSGKIINVSSVVGVIGNAGQSNYASSKAGLIGLTKSIAKEVAPRGITCNVIAPGFIETQMTDKLSDQVKENYLNNIPLRRFGTPEDVANVVAFLASPASDYITGQVLHIDGGLVM